MIEATLRRIGMAAGIGAVALLATVPDPSKAARPNIVVIQTDDQSLSSLRATFRNRDGKIRKVMPEPAAEFSALAMTRSTPAAT